MALLMAIILSAILLTIKRVDSSKKANAVRKTDEEWGKRENFRAAYTDLQLEKDARTFIENPQNAYNIDQEIKQAVSEMKYQKRNHNSLTYQDKLDIFLANRGKVSRRAAELGYWIGYKQGGKGKGKGYSRDLDTEMEQYGFMMWLQNALYKHHRDAKLVVLKTNAGIPFGYAWNGSPYERQCLGSGESKTNLQEFQPQMETSF